MQGEQAQNGATKRNYAAMKQRFIVWLASPELERTPTTQKALAAEMGVDNARLSNWKTPELMAKVNELVDKHLADDYSPVVDAMKRQARRGSFAHQKMYFEMIGKYVQKIAPTSPDGKEPYANTPTDQLFREIDALLDRGRIRADRSEGA